MKILILICSCNSEKSYKLRQACRDTWIKDHPNIEYLFFVGGRNDEPDVVSFDVNDSYNYLPQKVKACYQKMLEIHEFDYIFKCDDDTYVRVDRLEELLMKGDFVGSHSFPEFGFASGGAGYGISRKLLKKFSWSDIPDTGPEDVYISQECIKHSKSPYFTNRLVGNYERFPRETNDIVTCHWLSDRGMRIINIAFYEPIKTLSVRHIYWQDDLEFYQTYFKRKSNQDAGTWKMEDDKLYLMWERWDVEILTKTPEGYENDQMKIDNHL